MTVEQHQLEVDKLNKLEEELSKLIIDTNDLDLSDKYFKWQDQRNVCNEGFLKFIETSLSNKKI